MDGRNVTFCVAHRLIFVITSIIIIIIIIINLFLAQNILCQRSIYHIKPLPTLPHVVLLNCDGHLTTRFHIAFLYVSCITCSIVVIGCPGYFEIWVCFLEKLFEESLDFS